MIPLNNPILRLFLATKVRIFLLFIPLVLMVSGSIGFWFYYDSVYDRWLKKESSTMKDLNDYYIVLKKKTHPEAFKRVRFKSKGIQSSSNGVSFTTTIYDIKGRIIGKLAYEAREIVGHKGISPYFIAALISTEDRGFFTHNGVSYKGILRAMVRNIMAMKMVQGGSTLTQQLAKLWVSKIEKSMTRSLDRKIYEMFMAKAIERQYDKDAILLMYVNWIYFGHGVNGVETAAKFYFDKAAKDLDIGESSFLAGIISNPSRFSPFRHPQRAKSHHLRVLKGMNEHGDIPEGLDYKEIHHKFWANQSFKERSISKLKVYVNKAPYVVEEVMRQLLKKLVNKYNMSIEKAKSNLYEEGWNIYTSIDLDLQREAVKELRKGLKSYRKAVPRRSKLRRHLKGIQGALVSIEPSTGYIKAFVGGDKFTKSNQYNRAFQAVRQPGSAFKPICYLAALDNHSSNPLVSPYTLLFDGEDPIPLEGNKIWNVRNYGNYYLNRPITLTHALKISSNQVAARLVSLMGVERIRNIMIGALDMDEEKASNRYPDGVYSIALGTIGMTPLELAQVYAMIANHGYRVRPKLILEIKNMDNEIILDDSYSKEEVRKRRSVVSKEAAYLITTMMRHVLSQGGTGNVVRRMIGSKYDVVGKTGTSQKYHDLWFAGYNPELCTVVWVGHDKNMGLSGGGGKIAAPIFARYMNKAYKIYKSKLKKKFTRFSAGNSYNLISHKVCKDSGLIAVEGRCNKVDHHAQFIPGTEPGGYCDWDHSKPYSSETKDSGPPDEGDGTFDDDIIETSDERDLRVQQVNQIEELNDLGNKRSYKVSIPTDSPKSPDSKIPNQVDPKSDDVKGKKPVGKTQKPSINDKSSSGSRKKSDVKKKDPSARKPRASKEPRTDQKSNPKSKERFTSRHRKNNDDLLIPEPIRKPPKNNDKNPKVKGRINPLKPKKKTSDPPVQPKN